MDKKRNETVDEILDEMLEDTDDDNMAQPILRKYAIRLERALRNHDIELLTNFFENKEK